MAGRIKFISKDDVLRAMKNTMSNKAAARHLGVSFKHYKKYAKLYVDETTGKTLFESHLNQSGKGIPKQLKYSGKDPDLEKIMNGTIPIDSFSADKIKNRLIVEGILPETCSMCGFNERRVVDYRVPLILRFKDGNKRNFSKYNVSLVCYNCYFLYVGNIFTDKEIDALESYAPTSTPEPTWDMEEHVLEHFKNISVDWNEGIEEDDLISYYEPKAQKKETHEI